MKNVVTLVLLMVAIDMAVGIAGERAQDVLEKIRKKYESVDDAQVKFSQKTEFEMSKVVQTTAGVLYLKKENKYRVELEDQVIVTNGETVWKYSAVQRQVLIDRFKMDKNALSPERILTGAPADFNPTVLGKERVGKSETIVLKLTPKGEDAFVTSMKLWIDNSTWLIKKVDYSDASGKRTEYLVNDVKTNIGLDDSHFTYQAPEGVDVVDLR